MKQQRIPTLLALAGLTLFSAIPMGCPTWRTEHKVETTHKIEAHIVLDIRKVQEEAAKVEDTVRDTPAASPDDGKPKTSFYRATSGREVASRSLLSIFDLSSSAQAAEDDSSAAIARRKERFASLDKALSQGCLGENCRGMIELRSCDEAKKAEEKKKLETLVADENADRKIIYTGIAQKQGLDAKHFEAVGLVYAAEIRVKLKKGQSFQAPSDATLFEDFQKTPLGKSLPDAKKGEWVKVP